MQFVTAEGGLTTAGYVLFIAIAVLALLVGAFIAGKRVERKQMGTKQLVFCAMGIALAYATSYITVVKMPYGGSVTLFSMLFIVLIGYWYGLGTGLLVGFTYGILQFIQDPYFLTLLQVCLDYLFAFAALGLSGLFKNKKNGLVKGYITAVIARGIFASLAGYIFWMEYMPENFPQALKSVYPICYNFMYLLVEAVITVIVISIPVVKNALERVRRMAVE